MTHSRCVAILSNEHRLAVSARIRNVWRYSPTHTGREHGGSFLSRIRNRGNGMTPLPTEHRYTSSGKWTQLVYGCKIPLPRGDWLQQRVIDASAAVSETTTAYDCWRSLCQVVGIRKNERVLVAVQSCSLAGRLYALLIDPLSAERHLYFKEKNWYRTRPTNLVRASAQRWVDDPDKHYQMGFWSNTTIWCSVSQHSVSKPSVCFPVTFSSWRHVRACDLCLGYAPSTLTFKLLDNDWFRLMLSVVLNDVRKVVMLCLYLFWYQYLTDSLTYQVRLWLYIIIILNYLSRAGVGRPSIR